MTKAFKIEKGIQLTRGEASRKFPFNQMEVGDSFAVPADSAAKIGGAAYAYGKIHQMKFSVRKTADGHRCWRIA